MPLLFLLFLIETLSPIFSDIEFSKSRMFESTLLEVFHLENLKEIPPVKLTQISEI